MYGSANVSQVPKSWGFQMKSGPFYHKRVSINSCAPERGGSDVGWVFYGPYVRPLCWWRSFTYLLDTIADKNVKSSSIVYVSQHSFAVCPVGFLYLVKLKFLQQNTNYLDATRTAVRSSLGSVTGFNGVTRDFAITREQWILSASSIKRRYEYCP